MNSHIFRYTAVGFAALTLGLGCSSNDTISEVEPLELTGTDVCAQYDGWFLTEGAADKVSTWHQNEYGYKLKGDLTVLSSKWMIDPSYGSLDFVVVERSGNAEIEVWVDYFEEDYQVDNPPADMPPCYDFYFEGEARLFPADRAIVPVTVGEGEMFRTYLVEPAVPSWVDSFAIHIVKKGSGTATVARLLFNRGIVVPVPWGDSYDGIWEPCTDDNDCGDALFCMPFWNFYEDAEEKVCSYCASDEDCRGIAICGLNNNGRDCVVPHAKPLGEPCAVDEECTDGICCQSRCSACCENKPCEDEQTCIQIDESAPYQCNPGQGLYSSGELCYRNEDCASGNCDGEIVESGPCGDTDNGTGTDADAGVDTESACSSPSVRYGQCE
jgi:hypothetical protein